MDTLTEFLMEIAREFGIYAALVVGMVVWSYYRERDLNRRIDDQDRFFRETLVGTLQASTAAVTSCSAALERNTTVLERVLDRGGPTT